MKTATSKPFPRIEEIGNRKTTMDSSRDSKGLIADLVGSSQYRAVSDDASKDEDNAGWVLELEPSLRDEWIERISWIRLIDRLAEHELLCPEQPAFQQFVAGWQQLLQTSCAPPECVYYPVLTKIQSRWFGQGSISLDPSSIQAWEEYVRAIARYHVANLVIDTFEQYEQMLTDLAGSFFQVLPFLSEKHRQAARYFGVIDQFYNHLRDLHEDADQGICYLPGELLNWFGVERDEILQKCAHQNPNYHMMMQYWLEDYLPRLRRKARQLVTADDLHPSWQILRDWSIYRYRRIELVFRECQFDYTEFAQVYWQRVRADLPTLLDQVRQKQVSEQDCQKLPYMGNYSYLRGWKNLVVLPQVSLRSQLLSAM